MRFYKGKAFTLLLMLLLLLGIAACMPPSSDRDGTEAYAETATIEVLDTIAAATVQALGSQETQATLPVKTRSPTVPTPTPTITRTPTPQTPLIQVRVDTNCRTGPSTAYRYVGALLVGETTEVIARSSIPNYWIVENPDIPGETCWLWGKYASVSADTGHLPIEPSPPSPTPAPASIAGWTYIDVNGNGQRDAEEHDDIVAGARLTLRVGSCPGGMAADTVESNRRGRYRIENIIPASYCLVHDPSQQALQPRRYDLDLGSGASLDELNFRLKP